MNKLTKVVECLRELNKAIAVLPQKTVTNYKGISFQIPDVELMKLVDEAIFYDESPFCKNCLASTSEGCVEITEEEMSQLEQILNTEKDVFDFISKLN